MSVGLALAENEVRVILTRESRALADGSSRGLPGTRRAEEFLDALRDLGATVAAGEFSQRDVRKADVVIRWEA